MEAPRLPQSDPDAVESWSAANDAELIAGMRRGVEAAIDEFVDRYTPMLVGVAKRRGLRGGNLITAVMDFLDSAAMRLAVEGSRIPDPLPPWLVLSFRHRLRDEWRAEERRKARESLMATDIGRGSQRAVAETCSEYAIRLTAGIDEPDSGEGSVTWLALREALAIAIEKGLSEGDRQLLGYLADRMPQRDIADILGITHGNARVRILRLRERLVRLARVHINTLPTADGIALASFLDRPPRRMVLDAERARPPDDGPARAQSQHAARNPGPAGNRGATNE